MNNDLQLSEVLPKERRQVPNDGDEVLLHVLEPEQPEVRVAPVLPDTLQGETW